jgi:endonuclease/exonuclease/phosphatase family metal-dependent hydrolase
MSQELHRHPVDVWFLTELHADWEVEGQSICFAPPRTEAPIFRRKAAIATSWRMDILPSGDNPVEGRKCLARLIEPVTGKTVLAASTVLPWRGVTTHWRKILNREMSYAEVFSYVLDYMVQRIEKERRLGESVIWGGDFNQGLSGRDYVGTHLGRAALRAGFDRLGLQVPTQDLPALIKNHPAIDHIAVPWDWSIVAPPAIRRPLRNGKPLSDHGLYLVETTNGAT